MRAVACPQCEDCLAEAYTRCADCTAELKKIHIYDQVDCERCDRTWSRRDDDRWAADAEHRWICNACWNSGEGEPS